MSFNEGKRWGGFDWADQQKEIILIGAGGIGSWTALNLSRIGHSLYIFDGDNVDLTNVEGGQFYRGVDVGLNKANAIRNGCREYGCLNTIDVYSRNYTEELGMTDVCITGVDNMAARKLAFEAWENHVGKEVNMGRSINSCLFIDGRLLGELMEVICVQGNNENQIREYKEKHLFTDEEVAAEDCTTKSTTFAAMMISGVITASLCNFLSNRKLGMDVREVPFYQRLFTPIFENKKQEVEELAYA